MNSKKRIIPVLLALFPLFFTVACREPFIDHLPSLPDYWAIKAQGTPLYAYLDNDYNVSSTDTGKTAVFVSENPQAESVIIVAEQTPKHDDAVYIMNQETDTIISVFFHEDQRFPWLISVENGSDGSAEARLFGYNWSDERFSLEFEENGIITTMENIQLSRNALLSYQFNPSLSREQNVRLRNIYAALAVYESISRTFPNNGKIFLNTDNAGGVLSSVFADKSLSALAVSVKPSRPMIPVTEYASGENPAHFLGLIIWAIISSVSSSPPAPPPAPPPLSVEITTNDVRVNPDAIYYLDQAEEITFNFVFTNFTQNTNVTTVLYEPNRHIYIPFYAWENRLFGYYYNNIFYSFTQHDGSPLGRFTESYSIKIKRNDWDGYNNDGRVAVVIFFGQNTVVNGTSAGINFWEPGASGPVLNNSVFVLQFTVKQENARP